MKTTLNPSQKILWRELKAGRFYGLRFYPNYQLGPQMIDFYCPSVKLIIDIEKTQTTNQEKQRQRKEFYLLQYGATISRVTEDELRQSLTHVLDRLRQTVKQLSPLARE